ncbi:MAG: hypothetical protein WC905_04270 [Patescibacteria group bacterium]|jgi:hypothetical protein
MSKKQEIINAIYKQSVPFHSSAIMSLSGASSALISNTINTLLAEGKVSSRKDGKKNIYTLIDNSSNIQTSITQEPVCSIAEKFEYIREVVRMVINGDNPSALITGRPGVGKTYLVLDELKRAGLEKDEDFLFVSGHSSAFGLYKLLHDNRDCFIVLDDCDNCFKDLKSINLLKAALDSYDIRRVSWISDRTNNNEDIDPYFDFEGRIIFISNLYASRIDEAVRSRSFCINLCMSNTEVTEHMHNILEAIEPTVSMDIKLEVLNYIDTISDCFETYGLRTLIQSIRIRQGCTSSDWQKMIKIVSCSAR